MAWMPCTIDANDLVLAEGFPTPRMKIQVGRWHRQASPRRDVAGRHGQPDPQAGRPLPGATREAVRRGARVEYGKRLVDAETTPDGLVARFEDGTEAEETS